MKEHEQIIELMVLDPAAIARGSRTRKPEEQRRTSRQSLLGIDCVWSHLLRIRE